ncbi:MMPL family transporter [Thalassoglobus sp. JC818]|uniref:MMPL family transporter n=1 Tax=Thalassoglobus sp. JC818 TaxID=3232136 RepID=UPI003457A582
MSSPNDSHSGSDLLPRFLASVTQFVSSQPVVTLWIIGLFTLFSALVTARFLTFKTDRSDLIDSNSEFHQRWEEYVEKFGPEADIVIVVEGPNREAVEQAIDTVGAELRSESKLFGSILDRVDSDRVVSKGLQYLTPVELEKIENELDESQEIIEGDWNLAGLNAYSRRLEQLLQYSISQGDPARVDTAINRIELLANSLHSFLLDQNEFESPWPQIVSRTELVSQEAKSEYQLTPSGKMGFVVVTAQASSNGLTGKSESLNRLREICSETAEELSEVEIGMTGIPVLEADEMERSQIDMRNASLISFGGVGLILLLGFRGFRHPSLALIMLAVALVWALGYTTLTIGHLNILSVSFAAILIGLGIDFAIHYMARYLELRHHDEEFHRSLALTSRSVGTGIVTAAVTTSMAFLCATFTDFLGVAELGVIAGGGILLCAIATFTVLPALITLSDQNLSPQRLPTPFQGTLLRKMIRRFPALVTILTLVAIVIVGAQGFRLADGEIESIVEYDSNLLNLQAEGVESVELQERLFQETDGSLLYAVSISDSIEETRIRGEKFQQLDLVARVEDMASYLPRFPASETNLLIQSIHLRLSRLADLPETFPEINPLAVGQTLESLHNLVQSQTSPSADEAETRLDETLDIISTMELPQQVEILSAYQGAMLSALHAQLKKLKEVSDPSPVTPKDFDPAIHRRFVSDEGDWLIRVYPKEDIWEEKPLEAFIDQVRSVDPLITGTPIQNFEAARQIRNSYFDAAIYALVVVTLILLIDAISLGPLCVTLIAPLAVVGFTHFMSQHAGEESNIAHLLALYTIVAILVAFVFDFESTRNVILTLLPPIAGGFLMFGIFAMTNIDLNPANLIVLPLILGIGVDDGVHVTHDFRLTRGPYETSPSTINAVTLTSLTSMMGFGSMLVAAHQGLVSLGLVLVIGVGSCLFVSLVTLPAILTLIDRGRSQKPEKQVPPQKTEEPPEDEEDVVTIAFQNSETFGDKPSDDQ